MKNLSLSDTRNKLDDNSHLKQRRNNSKKTFKSLKDDLSDNKPSITRKVKAPTKGELYKQFTFSRSIAISMRKNGITVPKTVEGYGTDISDALESYRRLRLNKKKAARKIAQAKHSDSVAIKKYGKDTTKKSNKKKG
jgi:hypothetical protein